ncbi:MAG: bifunctional metallophosphatase/5'-nucleotidase, partial [Fusobacteriaceae bacterium]
MKKFLGLFALTMTMVSTNLTGAELTILHTNDLHAHVEPFLFRGLDPNRKVGGFANITTFAKSIKEQEKGKREVLFLDAGDYFTGPYISSLTEGEAIIDIMNTMGYDAVTVGNHEFDHGWENGREKLRKAEFPILLGNVYEDKTGKPFWDKPHMIIEKDGLKIGVIGLHGVFAFDDTVAAIMRKGISAKDEDEHLKKYISELKDKTDLIVLLVHQGTPARQSSFGGDDVERALKRDIDMARNIPGIDILITGHAHQGTPEPIKVNDTIIVSTNGQGSQVGRLDFTFDEKTKKITKYNGKLVTIYDDEIIPDEKTQKSIDKWKGQIEEITSKVIGKTDETLTRSYGTESLLGNLFADSLMESGKEFGAQFAVTNSGGIRNDIEAGEITYGNIISAAPFPN